MRQLVDAVLDFIKRVIVISAMGSFLLLVAGEVRLAALKKASQGSSKLSGFTQRMTDQKVNFR